MIARRDFTYEEWNCLLHLYRHETVDMPNDRMIRSFQEAGVTEEAADGIQPQFGRKATGRA